MAIKLNQSQIQTQQLRMTPQLQQAIKLLTLTHLEMTNVIAKEMVENPLLEEMGAEASLSEGMGEVDSKLDKLENQTQEATSDSFDGPDLVSGKEDFDWNSYIENSNPNSSSAPNMAKRDTEDTPNYENMVSKGMNLAEHLEWQLRMESLAEEEWAVAHSIIHNINDEGYLDIDFDEIISETGHDRDDAFEVLRMVQKLDPVGCAARDLKECLLIQADALPKHFPLVEKIIENHLEDLQRRDYTGIAKDLGVDKESIKDAEIIILGLNPKPGRLISPEETQYVVPDVYVYVVGGELVVHCNDDGVPNLKISSLYKNMLSAGNDNDEAKEYVQDKLRAAMWLIKSIQNRQKTIVRVANAIVKYQPEFFKKGAEYLRPMILKDIANEIGVHESTVSRVTTNKYMHTPLGIFELKYFFNSGVGGGVGGVDIASESLKLKVKQLIDNENKKKPLSDAKIVQFLEKEGIQVARRTVAKYREMMNIASSSKRKRLE